MVVRAAPAARHLSSIELDPITAVGRRERRLEVRGQAERELRSNFVERAGGAALERRGPVRHVGVDNASSGQPRACGQIHEMQTVVFAKPQRGHQKPRGLRVQTGTRGRKIGPHVEVYRGGEASDDCSGSCYVWIDQKQGDHIRTVRDDCKNHVVCGPEFTSGGRLSWKAGISAGPKSAGMRPVLVNQRLHAKKLASGEAEHFLVQPRANRGRGSPGRRGSVMPVPKMSGANETFVVHREDRRFAELLSLLRRSRPNVLVVGSSTDTDRAFELMYQYLRTPIVAWIPRESRDLPAASFRTLVVRDVDRLDSTQQGNLVATMCRLAGDVQVVSTAKAPLFPLVERGAFLDRLYYQLNIVYLELTDHVA